MTTDQQPIGARHIATLAVAAIRTIKRSEAPVQIDSLERRGFLCALSDLADRGEPDRLYGITPAGRKAIDRAFPSANAELIASAQQAISFLEDEFASDKPWPEGSAGEMAVAIAERLAAAVRGASR